MNDQMIANNILSLLKGACGLCVHGAIEAADVKVNTTFKQLLAEHLVLQKEIFDIMEASGWYVIPAETKKNIDKVVKKFASGA